jgi:hypothetical protein
MDISLSVTDLLSIVRLLPRYVEVDYEFDVRHVKPPRKHGCCDEDLNGPIPKQLDPSVSLVGWGFTKYQLTFAAQFVQLRADNFSKVFGVYEDHSLVLPGMFEEVIDEINFAFDLHLLPKLVDMAKLQLYVF